MERNTKNWFARLIAKLLGKKQESAAVDEKRKKAEKSKKPSDEVYPLF